MSAATPIPAEAVEHGEVFTRRWVVDLILDLSGYTPDRDLAALRVVEPACGSGAFLGSIVERLSESLKRHQRGLDEAGDAVRANAALVDAIQTDKVVWAVDQQPFLQGYLAIDGLWLYNTNKNLIGGGQATLTGPSFIDKSNIDAVAELAKGGTR